MEALVAFLFLLHSFVVGPTSRWMCCNILDVLFVCMLDWSRTPRKIGLEREGRHRVSRRRGAWEGELPPAKERLAKRRWRPRREGEGLEALGMTGKERTSSEATDKSVFVVGGRRMAK